MEAYLAVRHRPDQCPGNSASRQRLVARRYLVAYRHPGLAVYRFRDSVASLRWDGNQSVAVRRWDARRSDVKHLGVSSWAAVRDDSPKECD